VNDASGGDVAAAAVLPTAPGATARLVRIGVGNHTLACAPGEHLAFVVNDVSQTVSVLDTRSAVLVRTVAVGTDPVAIAVDTGSRRVFVANRGDNSVSVLDATR
jgi:YVTN family beta-propeller protein